MALLIAIDSYSCIWTVAIALLRDGERRGRVRLRNIPRAFSTTKQVRSIPEFAALIMFFLVKIRGGATRSIYLCFFSNMRKGILDANAAREEKKDGSVSSVSKDKHTVHSYAINTVFCMIWYLLPVYDTIWYRQNTVSAAGGENAPEINPSLCFSCVACYNSRYWYVRVLPVWMCYWNISRAVWTGFWCCSRFFHWGFRWLFSTTNSPPLIRTLNPNSQALTRTTSIVVLLLFNINSTSIKL